MGDASKKPAETVDADLVAAQFEWMDSDAHREALREALRARDAYRKLVEELKEKVEKLERGLVGPKSQRFKVDDDGQLSLQVLAELLGSRDVENADPKELADALIEQVEEEAKADAGDGSDGDGGGGAGEVHRRKRKPTWRRTAAETVQMVTLEIVPEEVKRLGTDAFERVGEERSTTIERRISSLVEVTVVRPKFRAKTEEAARAVQQARAERGAVASDKEPESWFALEPAPERPLPRAMAGPALLANVAVRRFDDHLPYNRLENIYEREGMRLGRSTLYGWLDGLRELLRPLREAMLDDARAAPYLCTDATGVLVQAPEKCTRGHFWAVVVPGRHVIFEFSRSHNAAAVDRLVGGYEGYIVADAHAVYDHLYGDGGATEVGCWGHARSYFFKALGTEPEICKKFLENLRVMFLLERKFADKPRKQRERMRRNKVKVLVDRHFELCREYQETALDETPLEAAIRYSLNQEGALRRFLDDGRLPATNNISERQLRRQAVGRKNWLFLGSNDGAEVNTTFATLIASCHMHGLEPEAYLRELLCVLPDWPKRRILELAPCNWNETRQKAEAQELFAGNVFLMAIREIDALHASLA